MQLDKPGDFVIGTGENHSIREFVESAFNYVGLDWNNYVEIDKKYFRPAEVDSLLADPSKAKKALNWRPKIKFNELVKIMVDYDCLRYDVDPPGEGIKILKNKGFNWTKSNLTKG